MSGSTFGEIERIFQRVRRLNQDARSKALAGETAGRPELRAEVESLLAAFDADDASFLDTPALGPGFPMLLSGATTAVPEQVGQYHIIEPLGEGGMATVFVAEQERPRRRVALKLMKTLLGPRAEKRFELEAMVLGRLRHPCIAQIYEAGIHQTPGGRIPYIAMELVEGERLTEFVRSHTLDLESTLRLFCRICDAVQHAHQQGVIHRDLKPSNILVEEGDGRLSPKLLDLGIARATDIDVQATTFETNVGELVGTVQYMSPEQATGDPDEIDMRSDVYSLGVVLFELLSGQLPYDLRGKPIHEALRTIREEEPRTLRAADASLRGDLDAIVIKALEKEKTRRYQSARELSEDIQRFLRSEPVTARHPSAAYQLRKFARRNRALVTGAAFVAAALVLGLIGTTIFAVRATRARKLATTAEIAERRQREAAESERALAQQRFEQVRNLAMLFIGEVDDRIRGLPGATGAREFIVASGLAYLDQLAQEAGDDAGLLMQVAAGYFRLGDIQGFPDASNLGDYSGALVSYDKGLALLRRVVDLQGSDAGLEDRYSIAYGHYAMVLEALNRSDEADAYFDKSYEYAQRPGQDASSHAMRLIAAYHENRLGDRACVRDEFDAADAHYQRARSIYQEVLDKAPDDSIAYRGVAAASDRLGRLARSRGASDAAVEHFETFVGMTETVLERVGMRADIAMDLAVGYEQLGLALRETARRDEAYAAFQKSVDLREQLYAADPRDRRALEQMLPACTLIGEESQFRGDLGTARRWFERLVKVSRKYAALESENPSALRELATAYYKMANLLLQMGSDAELEAQARAAHLREAGDWYGRALEQFTALKERGDVRPTDPFVVLQLSSERAVCDGTLAKIEERTATAE